MPMAVAIVMVVIAAYTAYEGDKANRSAKTDREKSRNEQMKASQEQKALNSQRAADERRRQVREERVRRAKIIQASENTGTEGSSGEIGALGGMNTQLQSNIGSNLGQLAGVSRINDFNQAAAVLETNASQTLANAETRINNAKAVGSIFQSAYSIYKS